MDYTKKHILKILRNRAFCQRTAVLISVLRLDILEEFHLMDLS